jgi:hypothetical protein
MNFEYNLEDIDPTWDRLKKGYYYEMLTQERLSCFNISFIGNSSDFEEWKKHTNTDYDIMVYITDKKELRVECKFSLHSIYHSWFMRDWYSRDCDVIVTNDRWCLSISDIDLLHRKGVVLLDSKDLIPYINNVMDIYI